MPTKRRAFAMYFLVPPVAKGSDLIITDVNQPYACAAPDLLVGLHGSYCEHALATVFQYVMTDDLPWRKVKVQARPRADAIAARSLSDGLRGMPLFDAYGAHAAVKKMMGEIWRLAAEAVAARNGQEFKVPRNFDWNDPVSYMCRFPQAASEVFRMLPALEVMIAYVKVRGQVRRVALVPIAKIEQVVEWGDDARHHEQIVVRCVRDRKATDIRLAPKTFTVQSELQPLVGYDRYRRGEHPLRRKSSPTTGASPSP